MISVNFNEQELNALLHMLDLGVKAGGLNAAGAAFMIQQKLATAVQARDAKQAKQAEQVTVAEEIQ